MLDPNEWSLAFAVAVVPRRSFYGSRRSLVLDGDRGQHLQVPVLMLNGPGDPGSVAEPMSIGAMENQARAYLENVLASAEDIQTLDRVLPGNDNGRTVVMLGADREPTLHEVWRD